MRQPLISTLFLSHFDQLIMERGEDVSKLIEQSGLPLTVLSSSETLIPFSMHARLLDMAANKLEWPTFALSLASRQSVGYLGPLYPMMQKACDVRSALDVFNTNLKLQVHAIDTWLEYHDATASFVIECKVPSIAESPCYQNHALALSSNLMQWLCGPSWKPRAVFFPRTAPDEINDYSRYFGSPVAFDAGKLCISFDAQHLNREIDPQADAISIQLRELLNTKAGVDVAAQVRFMIQALLPTGQCNTAYVADALGHTRRTLQRRLNQEHTSFQALLDSVRANRAKIYLSNSYYSMLDISLMLGFADQSSFTRCFNRWFNMGPREWRNLAAQHA